MIVLTLIPFIGRFFMFILKDPDLAKNLGVISPKAQIVGKADWPSYFSLLSQAISIGGLFAFGLISSWIFGREYSDRTIKDLLALPISRNTIILAKYIVIVLWSLFLTTFVLVLSLLVGWLISLPALSNDLLINAIKIYL